MGMNSTNFKIQGNDMNYNQGGTNPMLGHMVMSGSHNSKRSDQINGFSVKGHAI